MPAKPAKGSPTARTKTTIRLPSDVLLDTKIAALRAGRQLQDYVADILRAHLKADKRESSESS